MMPWSKVTIYEQNPRPYDEWQEAMMAYCRRDVEISMELYRVHEEELASIIEGDFTVVHDQELICQSDR